MGMTLPKKAFLFGFPGVEINSLAFLSDSGRVKFEIM